MVIADEIKSKLLGYVISKGVERVNSKPEVRNKIREFMHGEQRTLLLKIKEFNVMGFGLVGDRLVLIEEMKDPTVTVLIGEDTFLQLICGKITFRESFFYGDMDVQGSDWLRDFVVFNSIFEEFGHIAQEMGL